MIGRLFEDAIFAVRLGYFYRRSMKEINTPGFNPRPVTRKQKFTHAWNRAQFK